MAWIAYGLTFVQIAVGAVMRHADAGLAIARFPLANANSVIPDYWNFAISIHFAHRVGALVLTAFLDILLCSLISTAPSTWLFLSLPTDDFWDSFASGLPGGADDLDG